jgi:predicted TIM-barrel fold metal-dependent hydrolase
MENDNNMDRRVFLSRSGMAAAAAGTLGSGTAAGRASAAPSEAHGAADAPAQTSSSASQASPPDFIIDSHVHCGGTEKWVQAMVDDYRPRNAMVCVLTWPDDMELMVKAMEEYPDVFIGFGRVRPNNATAVRKIQTFSENGFVGMKFHSPRFNWDDPGYFEMYRMCEQKGMHMLFHTGSPRATLPTSRSGAPPRACARSMLDTICRQFPKATVQGAHFGNPWYEEAAEAARWNPNLFYDITGSSLLKLMKINDLERLSDILRWSAGEAENNPHTLEGGPSAWEHLVFGSDQNPEGLQPNIERFQQMMDVNDVPASVRPRMWGGTMADLLDLDPARLPTSG